MPLFEADKEKCINCGACVMSCPRLIVRESDDGYPFVPPEDEYYCMGCGHCVINCEFGAARLGDFAVDSAVDLKSVPLPPPQQSRHLLSTRRSVRRFRPDSVSRETLREIFDIARYAPSASNRQLVRWIVVSGKTLEQFKSLYMEKTREGLTSPGRYSRQDEQQLQGLDPVFRGAQTLVVAIAPESLEIREDAAIAITYLELAAHSLGVGTMWSGVTMRLLRRDRQACELLGIGEDEWVGGVMLLGFDTLPACTKLPNKKQPDITWAE